MEDLRVMERPAVLPGDQIQAQPPVRSRPRLSIVIPCFNETAVLPETVRQLDAVIQNALAAGLISFGSLLLIDDGSDDGTWDLIAEMGSRYTGVRGIKLARNYGHQRALLAGLLSAPGDAIISMDADLQDDPAAITEMIREYRRGADVVFAVRRQRTSDTFFKRTTAGAYYALLRLMGVKLVPNHADYRLLSRRVVEVLRSYREVNLFLRGLIPQLGFRSAHVYYDRHERFAGVSKYPVSKMMALAIEGITSFSDFPLRVITLLGLLVSAVSFGFGIWGLWVRLGTSAAIPGWASTVIPLYMLGGVQLLCMGMIGQYVSRIYSESKARPRYVIERVFPENENEPSQTPETSE